VGYLVPYDGRKSDLWGTAIPLEKIAGEYSSRLRAKHVLFALDSCQSGLAVSRGNPLDLNTEELRRFKALAEIETLSSEPGRTILTAGTGGQDALDVSGGIFTAALTDAIRGRADADHNGVVDYFELFAYVWGRVNAEARQWIRKQQPADYQLGNGRWVFVYH
jgi:helicase